VKQWVRDRLELGIWEWFGLVLTVGLAVSDLGSGDRKTNINRREYPRIVYNDLSLDFGEFSRKIVNICY